MHDVLCYVRHRWSKSVYKYLEACYRFMDIVYEAGYEPGTPEYEAAVAEVAVEFDKVWPYAPGVCHGSSLVR
jgi:hypothetical protein